MPFIPSSFQRLMEPLDRRLLARAVARHEGDRGVGSGDNAWTCARHLKALVFAQVAGLNSLREIVEGLSARPGALYHLGLRQPRRATLSEASARRPAAVFRDICEALMRQAARTRRREGEQLIRLLDASPIPIRDGRFTWAEADARTRGLKLHLLYDPEAEQALRFEVSSPRRSDIAGAREIAIEAGATYVFDKGYTDYGWWHELDQAGALFVTRLKRNARRREVGVDTAAGAGAAETGAAGAGILADRRLKIGHKRPRGGATNALYDTELREVVVARQRKGPLHLVTNDLRRGAEEIADLYRKRWEIEIFFKGLKQNLEIKRFLGRSENAVRIQIYVALIARLLLDIFKKTYARGMNGGLKTLLSKLKVALLAPFDRTQRAPIPPPRPRPKTPDPQLSFRLGWQ